MALREVVEYLVLRALAGRRGVVEALYGYFVGGASPAEAGERYGLSRHQVRGYATRVLEKAGSLARARAVIRYAAPIVLRIEPVVREVGRNMVRCLLCGAELPAIPGAVEKHLQDYHRDVVDQHVEAVIELMRRELHAGRSPSTT